jgi:hypothetical protein
MMHHELTAPGGAATSSGHSRGSGAQMGRHMTGRHRAVMAGAAILSAGLGGCINIAAPDAPIVIELNINIRQEVIYRLAEDAANTIEENPDIF